MQRPGRGYGKDWEYCTDRLWHSKSFICCEDRDDLHSYDRRPSAARSDAWKQPAIHEDTGAHDHRTYHDAIFMTRWYLMTMAKFYDMWWSLHDASPARRHLDAEMYISPSESPSLLSSFHFLMKWYIPLNSARKTIKHQPHLNDSSCHHAILHPIPRRRSAKAQLR